MKEKFVLTTKMYEVITHFYGIFLLFQIFFFFCVVRILCHAENGYHPPLILPLLYKIPIKILKMFEPLHKSNERGGGHPHLV